MAPDLSIYEPKDLQNLLKQQRGEKTVEEWGEDPWGIDEDEYKLVKEYIHKCPKCGNKTKRKDEDEIGSLDLRCPNCGGDVTFADTIITWD